MFPFLHSRLLRLPFSKAEALLAFSFSLLSRAVNATTLSFNWISWLFEKINKII